MHILVSAPGLNVAQRCCPLLPLPFRSLSSSVSLSPSSSTLWRSTFNLRKTDTFPFPGQNLLLCFNPMSDAVCVCGFSSCPSAPQNVNRTVRGVCVCVRACVHVLRSQQAVCHELLTVIPYHTHPVVNLFT